VPVRGQLASDATTHTFNGLGQKTQMTTPAPASQSGSETTSYSYDGNGKLIQTTAPPTANGGQNQVTQDTYTSTGELAAETTGYGTSSAATTSYCYDPNGNRSSVVYADGNTTGIAPCETSSPWAVSSSSNPTQVPCRRWCWSGRGRSPALRCHVPRSTRTGS